MRRHILTSEEVERCRNDVVYKDHLIASGPTVNGGTKRLYFNPRNPLFTIVGDDTNQTTDNPDRAAMLYSEI